MDLFGDEAARTQKQFREKKKKMAAKSMGKSGMEIKYTVPGK